MALSFKNYEKVEFEYFLKPLYVVQSRQYSEQLFVSCSCPYPPSLE